MQLQELKDKYLYDETTPVMRQYLDIKFVHMNCILLYRMGDFYELFFEDAIVASNILNIVLTKRGKFGDSEIPMCGVPFHALNNYLNKLIENGYSVAICEQVETAEEAKKRGGYKAFVKREVVRIITPGTITDETLIQDNIPNYLVSIAVERDKAAICYVDISTADISVVEVPENEMINELTRISPKEILLAESFRGDTLSNSIIKLGFCITFQVNSFFAINKCLKIIQNFYNISSIKAIGELSELQVSSIGSIIEYVNLTQKRNLPSLPFPKIINFYNFVSIDAATRRNLEIVSNQLGHTKGSVLGAIDHTVTKAGSRLLYKFISAPLVDITRIEKRLLTTEFFFNQPNLTANIRKLLTKSADLERCIIRISMNKGSPKDLLSIKYTINIALKIKEEFFNQTQTLPDYIANLIAPLSGDDELYDLIDQSIREDAPHTINEGGVIKYDYHPKIAELINLINNGKSYIENLRKLYQDETGIDSLKISHNNVLGLYIDVTPKQSNKIFLEKFIHRQTTTTSIRYTTLELQKLESDMVNSRSLMIGLETELFNEICQQILSKSHLIKTLSNSLSYLDVYCNFGYNAYEYNYIKPQLFNDLRFEVTGGRHVVIEQSLNRNSQSFVKNDCTLAIDNRVWLITGPNMAGKSTYLRQNAIIAILAQAGSFVPADELQIGIIDKIFSRIGSGDDLLKGQSTFMVEMLETSAILAQSTERSLIILDEVGRGTSTYDGMAIAWSVLEYIHNKLKCRCLFATHYHELTNMSNFLPAIRNYTVSIQESGDDILFLHQIIPGTALKSYGIHVANLAGLPQIVIQRANEILYEFENNYSRDNINISLPSDHNKTAVSQTENVTVLDENYVKLKHHIENIDPDQLTPKEALNTIYDIKKLCALI